jgi:predicted porin
MPNRTAVLSAAVGAALLALSGQVYAQATGLQVTLSGQVNRAILYANDGEEKDVFFVDNDISGTRFRIAATAPITPGLRAGAVFESEFQSNASDEVSFAARDVDPRFLERHMDIFLEGGWGKLSLGQGDGAANGAMEVDLSGTSVAHWSGTNNVGGAFGFRGPGGALVSTVGGSLNNQDFESRYDRVRYDTPKFGGFSVAGSFGTKASQDVREIALWYTGDLGPLGRLAGAIGYSNQNDAGVGQDDETTGGSISWLHGSGFNVTFGHSQRDFRAAGDEGKFTYAKVGYKFGRHAVALDWGKGDDLSVVGDEGTMIGAGYVWAPVPWADVFAAIKRHSLDRSGVDTDDINFVMVGTRVKF